MYGLNPRPLMGRDTVLSSVLESLTRPAGHGAAVAAETGLGKTAFAAAVAQKLQEKMPVHWVYSSPALQSVPYGALASLLPDLAPGQTGSPLAVMRALIGKLSETAGGLPAGQGAEPLIIVDDAHDIDGPSLDLLAQLLEARHIRLLVLTRSFQDISGVLPHTWDGQLSRHRLLPLDERQVLSLCQQELQGQISAAAAVELARLTGGNPMYLLAVVDEAVRGGFLVQRQGIWVATNGALPVGGRVGDLVKTQIRGLDHEDRAAMEVICLAEPLPLTAGFRLGLHESVDRLTDSLLVKVSADARLGQVLRPLHPLYGDVVRGMVPAVRSARLLQQLQHALDGVEVGEEGVLRRISWALALGADIPEQQLLFAAETANNRSDPRLALRAAAAVGQGKLRIPAQIQEARALLLLGEAGPAAAALEGTLEQAPDLHTVKQAMLVHIRFAMTATGETDWAGPLALAWTRVIDRLSKDEPLEAVERARCGAQLLGILRMVREGDYVHAELELAQMLRRARESADRDAILCAEALTAEVLMATGRAQTALEHSTVAMQMLQDGSAESQLMGTFVLHRHLDVLGWLGEWEQLQETVGSVDSPVQPALLYSGGVVDFALGISRLRSNAPDDAARHFSAAAEAAALHDPQGILPLALALGSFAAGSLGQRDLAGRMLAEAGRTAPRGPEQFRLLVEGILAGGRYLWDSDEASMKALRESAEQAQERSFTAVEFTLRHLYLRLGGFDDAGRLLKVTEGFEGPQAAVLNRVARAVVDQDCAALAALVADPDPEMDELLAKQCLAEALRLARRSNNKDVLNRIERLTGRRGSGNRGSLPGLTRRERDIAALVADGHRNAEIAGMLNLSVRTVEGHIYRTYEKLGISRREELKEIFPQLDQPSGLQNRIVGAE